MCCWAVYGRKKCKKGWRSYSGFCYFHLAVSPANSELRCATSSSQFNLRSSIPSESLKPLAEDICSRLCLTVSDIPRRGRLSKRSQRIFRHLLAVINKDPLAIPWRVAAVTALSGGSTACTQPGSRRLNRHRFKLVPYRLTISKISYAVPN